ncbi:MAG: LCP family protein [Chloroflexi bacterium]|nr:LCP family protein [Chloroflexota bacterium]
MKHHRSYTLFFIPFAVTAILMLGVMPGLAQTHYPVPGEIPEPMPMVDEGNDDIINFLLIGSDTENPRNAGRTDVLLIMSVNRTAGTVAMLSLPRDLYVYIPGHRSYRINAAYGYGEQAEAGSGPQLLIDTIRHNLGLRIDYYARVDFNDFRRIVDDLGGIEVVVDCALQDWQLIAPDLDPQFEDSWELVTLDVGVHWMDGDQALWYARSRRTSSDFDRGRRHQVLMRALWNRIQGLSLTAQLTDIWPQVLESVQTDISLDLMLELVPLALSMDSSRIASYTFRPNVEVRSWLSPEGSNVLVPVRASIAELERQFMQPPTEHQLVRERPVVEIVNATGVTNLARVAADRLAWDGFTPRINAQPQNYRNYTMIYDYTGQTKGSSLEALQMALRVSDEGVVSEPDPDREVDFRVVLGGRYLACTHGVLPPQ